MKKSMTIQNGIWAGALPGGRKKTAQRRLYMGEFKGYSGKNGEMTLLNLETDFPFLRSHPLVHAVEQSGLPLDIRGISLYNDSVLLYNMEEGHIGFFVLRDGAFTRCFATVEQYPTDFSGEDYGKQLVLTEDTSPHLTDDLNAQKKLLFFPAGKLGVLGEEMEPNSVIDMPSEVPELECALVAAGRLYGVKGQTLYVSGTGGCFDWQTDGVGENPNPNYSYKGKFASFTEKQLPVTALCNYKGNVYIFHENALQKVVGSENPFAVKDLFAVGTQNGRSVREAGGLLYFIDGNRPLCFNGSSLRQLPSLPEGAVLNGAAFVQNGKYCFSLKSGNAFYIYSYDPLSDSYGVLSVPKEPLDYAMTKDGLYIFVADGSEKKLYKMGDTRVETYFECILPLFREDLSVKRLSALSLHLEVKSYCYLSVALLSENESGQTFSRTLLEQAFTPGSRVLCYRGRLPATRFLTLKIWGQGDLVLKGIEAECVEGLFGRGATE